MRAQTIESLEDPRVALYCVARDPELRRRGFFMVEGRANVRCLIERSRFRTHSVLVTPAGLAALGDTFAKLPSGTPVYLAQQSVLNDVVGYNMHRGVLAAAECRSPTALSELSTSSESAERPAGAELPASPEKASLIVALERVADPDNVGSIFRSAAAFGARGILLCPRCCDPLYRKAVRVSMGAALLLPFVRCQVWPDPLLELRAEGYRVVALHPDAPAIEIADFVARLDRERDARFVLVLGSEGWGLSQGVLELADARVRIGMAPGADSINVGTAAGIALHRLAEAIQAMGVRS